MKNSALKIQISTADYKNCTADFVNCTADYKNNSVDLSFQRTVFSFSLCIQYVFCALYVYNYKLFYVGAFDMDLNKYE
ncbi:MAG: hypothetical protein LUD00_08725 [Prevotellaceae bacterium]|nr:hypothetical protein [Prevotellaceae bacterium]